MRMMVTGGAGFIGSAYVRLAVREGHDVLVADKLTYAGHLSSLREVASSPLFRFEHADICEEERMASLLRSFEPDAVIHLAAESHVDRSITGAGVFVETNIVGTFRLLESVLRYWETLPSGTRAGFRFVQVSTDEVFGSLGEDGHFTEETPYDPRSPYSASKAAADHLARAWRHTYGLPVSVSNCSNNYGPYQLPEKLIPLIILNALEGRDLPVYGDGGNIRDWLHVEDHARALMMIVQADPGETYNVGGRNERTNLEVVRAICDLLDAMRPGNGPRRDLITFVADRKGHDRRYGIDATKLETRLGWRAGETFEAGLERTVRWYLDNDWWWRPLRQSGHGSTRLGLA
ncbi:MAG: dTDP-glucose 4,6-dehydratase [Alphaproteobacteria bacterium]|nr:dTDP-glucose 4,6-dehydratase [Alphaproteobacteria bacterium]MDZ4762526.1 dTDP-glucose 4,6-dehydratase [Alphaproteobacteria bacterium]